MGRRVCSPLVSVLGMRNDGAEGVPTRRLVVEEVPFDPRDRRADLPAFDAALAEDFAADGQPGEPRPRPTIWRASA